MFLKIFADNLNKANKLIKKYQVSSDVTSDNNSDIEANLKRKRKAPRRLSYGSSDDDLENESTKQSQTLRPPNIQLTLPEKRSAVEENSGSPASLGSTVTYVSSTPQASTPSSHISDNSEGFQRKLTSLLLHIKEQNSQILRWINNQNTNSFSLPHQLPDDIPVKLPITILDDIQILEDYLNENNKLSLVIKYFSNIGGRDATTCTNNILKNLMNNEIATNFSFLGTRGGKKAFFSLNLRRLVVGVAQLSFPTSTETEIFGFIKVWLKHAPQRVINEQRKRCRPENFDDLSTESDLTIYLHKHCYMNQMKKLKTSG